MSEIPARFIDNRSFSEIHHGFAETDYGEALAEEIRYDHYRPEHIDPEQWRRLLGADVNNLRHGPLTYGLTRVFLREANQNGETEKARFSKDEQQILLLAAITNTWPEAVAGNVHFEEQTEEHEAAEQQIFGQLFDQFMEGIDIKARLMVERTLFDRSSKLGRAFNAIKRIGYLRAGLRAFEISSSTPDKVLSEHLEWMTAGILANQVIQLTTYAEEYPYVARYLEENQHRITAAFTQLDPAVFSRHQETSKQRVDLFEQNRHAWERFISSEESVGAIVRDSFDRGIFGEGPNLEKRLITDYKELEAHVEACRTFGLKIVLTSGSFDMKHVGHERYLYMARQHGDLLLVGVDSDTKVKSRKGEGRPINPENERIESLIHLRYVDLVTLKGPNDPKWHLIKTVRPDTLILTQETYDKEDIDELKRYCGRVTVLPPQATTSTSAKIGRFLKEHTARLGAELDFEIEEMRESGTIDETSADILKQRLLAMFEKVIEDA